MTLPLAVFNKMFSRRGLVLLCTLIFIAIAAVTVVWANHGNLLALSNQKTQTFSELYFTQPNQLPDSLVINQPQTATFTIANRTQKTITYHYSLKIHSTSQADRTTAATVTINPDRQTDITVPFTLPAVDNYTISITLPDQKQSIQFHSKGVL